MSAAANYGVYSPNYLTYARINGVVTPGTIPRGGVKGFKRETGWDEKRGKGTKGATLTLSSAPPCHGSILLQLIGPGGVYANGQPSTDLADWDIFVAQVLSIAPTQQQAQGLAIFYPLFLAINLTSVVVKHYSPPEYMGRGMYHAEIELIEWVQPPPVSVVSTVQATKVDTSGNSPALPPPEDPRLTQAKANFAAASQATQP
jgi:hypothetical protein